MATERERARIDTMPERLVTYADPAELTRAVRELSFLEVLRRMIAGELPNSTMMDSLDLGIESAEPGRVVFTGTPGEAFLNPMGTLHGGWYGSLLDSALGCAVQTMLPLGKVQTTLEFKINLVRAVRLDGRPVRSEARTRHVGQRTGTAEGDIHDADGKLLAHASTTCLILDF